MECLCGSDPRVDAVVDSVEKSSGLLIGKKSRPSELTEFYASDTMWYSIAEMWLVRKVPEDSIWKR